jgi:transcriptional regulator with XRE-family HTH domain
LTLVLRHVFDVRQPPNPALAALLKRLREDREITQEQLAFAADITVSALSRIERGLNNPGWTTVARIVEALGLTLVEFATYVEESVTDAGLHDPDTTTLP